MNRKVVLAERYHDICCGHRVVGHEGKCRLLHGHNYRVHFAVEAEELDSLGRVVDFAVIKSTLCEWLESHWDHHFLLWEQDPLLSSLREVSAESIVVVPFNPTAENMALYLLDTIAPILLESIGCRLVECRIEETRKCSVAVRLQR